MDIIGILDRQNRDIVGSDTRCRQGSKISINAVKAAKKNDGKKFANPRANELVSQARKLFTDHGVVSSRIAAEAPAVVVHGEDEQAFITTIEALGLQRPSHSSDSIYNQSNAHIEIGEWYRILGAESFGVAKVLGGNSDTLAVAFEGHLESIFAVHSSRIKAVFTDFQRLRMTQESRDYLSALRLEKAKICRENGIDYRFLYGG